MNLTEPITKINGIGEKKALLYRRLGIETIEDLLTYYPRTYETFDKPVRFSQIVEGELISVAATIRKRPDIAYASKLSILSTVLFQEEERLKLIWFRMPYLRSKLVAGSFYIFRGRAIKKGGILCMEQPQIYTPAEYEQLESVLQPVYSLTKGITSKQIGKTMKLVLDSYAGRIDYLPEDIRKKYHLIDYVAAIQIIHFPQSFEQLVDARRRLVFDEFLFFILMTRNMKENTRSLPNSFPVNNFEHTQRLLKQLPYSLTNDQMYVWDEIRSVLTSEHLMNRLVQGDVGSGKTVLAILALLLMVENGYQGAIMAPTEVLARQHYESIQEMFCQYQIPFKPVLLTGALSAKEKRNIYSLIASGNAQIIIGTHALIQDKVSYHRLAIAITDEQHRFGVRQRETFSEKGICPHIMVMSATPIPRTLAMIVYGDMDVSLIREMPKERLPIKNCLVDTTYRKTAYQFIQKEILAGRQAYIICPMVEAGEDSEMENVLDYTESLRSLFPPEICIGYLHGKMKPSQKEEIMEAFSRNVIHLLVSTTVIEVGINVPNATVIIIENSERFGLAQLHQLRGRVGRGREQSYCIFMKSTKDQKKSERLDILNKSNDGFYIAEQDMKLRGPGDLFGLRQSGLLDFKLADIFQDAEILKEANDAARDVSRLLEEDEPQIHILKEQLSYYTIKHVVL